MSDDLISRKAAIDAMATWNWQDLYLPIHFKQLLEELPSAQPFNKGLWVKQELAPQTLRFCSLCGCKKPRGVAGNFCPNCGASMDGGKERK